MTAPVVVPATAELELADGTRRAGHTWAADADPVDHRLLALVEGPVLDVGCGPARATVALAEAGIPALGIDITPEALALARARGATVLERCVFSRLPATGRWGTVLLLDGNIGIGGDPAALLARCAGLLRPGGLLLVETDPPGTSHGAPRARLVVDGAPGPWFAWSTVAADAVDAATATVADLAVADRWSDGGRWFCALRRGGGR